MFSKTDKLPLETEPVACDNTTNGKLKPGHQTFVTPYSSDNPGTCMFISVNIRNQILPSLVKVIQIKFAYLTLFIFLS